MAIRRLSIIKQVTAVREALESVSESDRLEVIAEAMVQINYCREKSARHLQASCGCYDWDISIDYRPHHDRHPEMHKVDKND